MENNDKEHENETADLDIENLHLGVGESNELNVTVITPPENTPFMVSDSDTEDILRIQDQPDSSTSEVDGSCLSTNPKQHKHHHRKRMSSQGVGIPVSAESSSQVSDTKGQNETDDFEKDIESESISFTTASSEISNGHEHDNPHSSSSSPAPPPPPEILIDQEPDFLSSLEWKTQDCHVFIFSESGKPVFSRHGNEDKLVTLFGLMQALVSVVQDGGDSLRSIKAGSVTIVFLTKSPLILVCVSRLNSSVPQIQTQLLYYYNQLISILTSKQLVQIYEKRKNYDLRRLLAGSERLLTNLSTLLEEDPSFLLGAVKCLPLANSVREQISSTIIQHTSKLKNVVFAILVANNQLVTIVRMKKCFMHPMDLHIILNLIDSSESFKAAESWTPICLPKFDPSGFVHAHVSYLADDCQACLIMLTVDRDSFFVLSEAKQKIVERLRRYKYLDAINSSMSSPWPTMANIHVPEVRHFIYKFKSIAQFTTPTLDCPYTSNLASSIGSVSGNKNSLGRLLSSYSKIHGRLHNHSRPLKLVYIVGDEENFMGWSTANFELYVTFEPLVKKSSAISNVNKLLKWVKKEEERIFIINSPTF